MEILRSLSTYDGKACNPLCPLVFRLLNEGDELTFFQDPYKRCH